MINKSLSLLLGITLSLSVLGIETLAYPNRVRFNPNAGVHRTIIAPNTNIGNGYPRSNYNRRGGGNYTFRERITIQRDRRGSCYYCGYSNGYNPYGNDRVRGETYRLIPQDTSYPYYR
ncbi:hypothetical protein [Cyanothece sp. BG0011]|uniref:hypothetical protein n=1 Tax=Cyanothece sp. BG0011 TaxID=2082950 RepID=UPI000D1EFCAC|nr:hypothetical protein [Cyanothece sp. BG0011]